MRRQVFWGALFGGTLGAPAALLVAIGIWSYQIAVVDCTSVDRIQDSERLCCFLWIALIAGSLVGAVGGFVASICDISIPLGVAWVAFGVCVGRIASVLEARPKCSPEPSIVPSIVGGMAAAAILTAYGIWHARRRPR